MTRQEGKRVDDNDQSALRQPNVVSRAMTTSVTVLAILILWPIRIVITRIIAINQWLGGRRDRRHSRREVAGEEAS